MSNNKKKIAHTLKMAQIFGARIETQITDVWKTRT